MYIEPTNCRYRLRKEKEGYCYWDCVYKFLHNYAKNCKPTMALDLFIEGHPNKPL